MEQGNRTASMDNEKIYEVLIGMTIGLWMMFIARIFLNLILFKFAKEGVLLELGGEGMETRFSHQCRQTAK